MIFRVFRRRRKRTPRARIISVALVAVMLGGAGCGGSPTAPTPSVLALTCPANLSVPATAAVGAVVSYSAPVSTGGRAPVSITCIPGSGGVFPAGTTPVSCTATDAAAAIAVCTFGVAVTPAPRLKNTKFLAFGDSITAGEVTVPMSVGAGIPGSGDMFRQVLVPNAAYPTVLNEQLSQRYVAQSIDVVNAGRPGDAAQNAVPRFQSTFAANQPEVLLMLMGYNDLGSFSSAAAAYRAVEQMIKEARLRGARVFLATLTPSIPGRQRSSPEPILVAYNDALRTLAAGENAVLVDLYQAALPNVEAWIGVDGLHPTEAGYAKIADTFYSAIRADLEAR